MRFYFLQGWLSACDWVALNMRLGGSERCEYSMMISHIIELLEEKAITLEDLEGFSDDLRERLEFLFGSRDS